ncbi:MAG: hypothetical protein H7249_07345 [Chitinophagaceae bacterium]|nr:hypothetical protein [Oligoflexus sp.]
MKNTSILSSLLTSLLILNGCSNAASFDAQTKVKSIAKTAAEATNHSSNSDAEPTPEPITENKPDNTAPLGTDGAILESIASVVVQIPSPNIRAGKETSHAVATISGTKETGIVWSIVGPTGVDPATLGSIDANGLYTSPADGAADFAISIVATLAKDPSVSGKADLKIIPAKALFAGCVKGDSVFPITADVFDNLDPLVKHLPDFASLKKADVVCLDQFNIPQQAWSAGFPSSPARVEYFGIRAVANLIIEKDGNYDFQLNADDGANLYVDGVLQVNDDGQHGMQLANKIVKLTAGKHKIMMDWYQGPRVWLGLVLSWKTPAMIVANQPYVVVPRSAFAIYEDAK